MVMNNPYTVQLNNDHEKEIVLQPGQNIFTVDFTVLNYDDAAGNRYYYKLDGIMNDWKENQNGHLIFYNLPRGNYMLHVSGGDKYGNKFKSEESILVDVKPYWWQTNLFYIFLIFAVALIIYSLVIRRIKLIRHKAEMKQKMAETEMIALRAQMNPHFIFNCLNSIDNLIQTNEKEKATTYLTTFSKLIRTIFQNSDKREITLFDEIETCRLYTQLEGMRFGNKLSYSFDVDETIDLKSIMVPALILQPFIENAIWHGIMPIEEGGTIHVTISKKEDKIFCIVEDDGIGRDVSMQKRLNGSPSAHQSTPYNSLIALSISLVLMP